MIHRFLCAFIGAALVGAFGVPARVAAKPPDLPENSTFTVTPVVSPDPFFRLRSSPHPTSARSPLSGKQFDVPSGHPQPADDDIFTNVPKQIVCVYRGFQEYAVEEIDWWKLCLSIITRRQQPPPPEQNDGYIRPIVTGVDYAFQVVSDAPVTGDETPRPAVEVLPMPREVTDVTCPYLRQKMTDRQTSRLTTPDMGRDVIDNLKRLKQADELLDQAKEFARAGLFGEALTCCGIAADLCPGSPCAKRAEDAMLSITNNMIQLTLNSMKSEDSSEESEEDASTPSPDYEVEVGTSSAGGLRMSADCSLGGKVYHLRYKQGCLSIWKTPDSGKAKPQ